MEEKTKKNGMGFAVGLTIISILAIAILGYFVCFLLNARKDDSKTVAELNNKVDKIQARINLLEDTDLIEEDVDDTALGLFENAVNLIGEVTFTNFEDIERATPADVKEQNGKEYHKTVMSYEDKRDEYDIVFGGKALDKIMNTRFLNVDGVLYVSEGGATGWELVETEIEKVSEQNGETKYKANYKLQEENAEKPGTCNFTIKEVDGNYLITDIDFGIMGL